MTHNEKAHEIVHVLEYNAERPHLMIPEYGRHLQKLIDQATLIEDKEERVVEVADDIVSVFNENPEAKTLFDKMSYTHKKEYIRWIEEAKKPETRENRKIKMIQMILDGKKGI